ncbi:hypothetical protein [Metabacillus sp. RGM 3146]|uniref:hypothetical protein n=1 Tax=Metabacillus sp. RGM 3146 TaxID=3401092 RepID=UPI003B995338
MKDELVWKQGEVKENQSIQLSQVEQTEPNAPNRSIVFSTSISNEKERDDGSVESSRDYNAVDIETGMKTKIEPPKGMKGDFFVIQKVQTFIS